MISGFKKVVLGEMEKIKGKLGSYYIYPLREWRPGAYIVTIKCIDWRYTGSQYYFSREPKNSEERELMERFAGLSHALLCPRLDMCPTSLKYVDKLAQDYKGF